LRKKAGNKKYPKNGRKNFKEIFGDKKIQLKKIMVLFSRITGDVDILPV
jgi:hypothetical protein